MTACLYPGSRHNRPVSLGTLRTNIPNEFAEGGYGPEIDRFSAMLIYCALRCLRVGGKPLWDRFYDGDNLLFGCRDLERPEKSRLFRELRELPDEEARTIAGHLVLSAKGTLEAVPTLDQIVKDGLVAALTDAQQRELESLIPTITIHPRTPRFRETTLPMPAAGMVPPLASSGQAQPKVQKPASSKVRTGHRFWLVGAAVVMFTIALFALWPRSPRSSLPREHPQPKPPLASGDAAKDTVLLPSRAELKPSVNAHKLGSGSIPSVPIVKPFTNSIGMKLVPIPAGEFIMGSPDGQGKANEHPQHKVLITKPFYLGAYEVTQKQFEEVTGTNPSDFKLAGENAPVEHVSWEERKDSAQRFHACRPNEHRAGVTACPPKRNGNMLAAAEERPTIATETTRPG